MIKLPNKISPRDIAIFYSLFSVLTSISMSAFEGSLYQEKPCYFVSPDCLVHPLYKNFSTLIDFGVLNPIVIYFLAKSHNQSIDACSSIKLKLPGTSYQSFWFSVLSITISLNAMWYYFYGFINGQHYDAVIMPDSSGDIIITKTGWVVFLWTILFLSILIFFSFKQFLYILFLLSLKSEDVDYRPQHEDSSGGLNILVKPTISYFYSISCVLLIFIIFALHDYWGENISESKRMYALIVYVLIAFPLLFIPILHLHRLMKFHRNKISSTMRKKIDHIYNSLFSNRDNLSLCVETDLQKFEYIEKHQALINNLPIWPLPITGFFIPMASIIVSILIVIKDFYLIFHKI